MRQSLRRTILTMAIGVSIFSGALAGEASAAGYKKTNLVSDGGAGGGTPLPATFTDAQLQNPWGISFLPGGPFWISDNATGVSTIYDGAGHVFTPLPGGGFTIPGGSPTGQVANTQSGAFKIPNAPGGAAGTVAALFIFAGENGVISAWQPGDAKTAIAMVDNSATHAVYKGLAMASSASGVFLYVTDFRHAKVNIYDSTFTFVKSFQDTTVPAGFAPFGIANIDGNLFVTFAKQDAQKHDDVPGPGNGVVDVFDPDGHLIQRFASGGALNSPWAVAKAPLGFGVASSDILIGNFGDGWINGFKPTGVFDAALKTPAGTPLVIPGLWGLTFATGVWGGALAADPTTLYFTAGPRHERNGLFGAITPH